MKKLAIMSFLVFYLCLTFLFVTCLSTDAQSEYSIGVRGYSWDHPNLTISIVPQTNQSWWKPFYLDAALQGVAQWNDAIQEFAILHPEFSYLSQLILEPTVNTINVSGFDAYIGWRAACESEEAIGLSQLSVSSPCIAINGTVCLAAKAPSGHVMNEVDMQNIVVHEFGHTLGLSHCNISNDIMYPTIYYWDNVKPLSSLDIYAVSQIFNWIENSAELNSSISCIQESVVILPSNIVYEHFSIAEDNLPDSKNFVEYAKELILRLEIFIILIATIVSIIMVAIFKRSNRSQKQNYIK